MGLMVTRIFAPESAAASLRLKVVRDALTAAGHTMRVITTNPGKPYTPDALIKRLPVWRRDGYVKGYASYLSFDLQAFFHLLVASRPEFVLVEPPPTTGVVARVATVLRKVPYFWYAADVWSDATASMEVPTVVKRAVRAMESFAITGARGVIAVSEDVAQRARELGAKDVCVVPNGADTQTFNLQVAPISEERRAELGIKKPYFLYAGTASVWQGADLFARAMEQLEGVQLLYLARGENLQKVEEIARRLRTAHPDWDYDPIVVHPLVDAEEAAAWQRGARACLVSIKPSVGYDFAYPTKVLTALACGTPVIYAGVGPAGEEITANQLGRTCPYDATAVAQAMREVATETPDSPRLHQWVVDNRSMQATGVAVADYLRRRLHADK